MLYGSVGSGRIRYWRSVKATSSNELRQLHSQQKSDLWILICSKQSLWIIHQLQIMKIHSSLTKIEDTTNDFIAPPLTSEQASCQDSFAHHYLPQP